MNEKRNNETCQHGVKLHTETDADGWVRSFAPDCTVCDPAKPVGLAYKKGAEPTKPDPVESAPGMDQEKGLQ